ncbi:sushi domain-containing protein 1 isoform X3 [Salarias fasciatus]|uniref:sushi domain-containing protein 1 isoform X3 n=1 Tax=Salarias fasciatus TaxID=181472 RepID=UPI00117678CA|nr:sushi domain-containing protein 1-like isoform X3 [Salarias fasciatus]
MDGRKTAVTVVFLLCVFTGKPAGGQSVLDVCASCHLNATCDDKADGSGKVCNCKYGFVGNGRTFCQDKDECQIGASKICGQHTTCHNTHGSYYCTCLAGYSPSNSMAIFIPNDGTHCRGASEDRPSSVTLSRSCQVFALDVDECRVSGVCGEGARCRNLDGSFDCSCQVGYRVHDGVEPFHPARDNASCKVVDCGQPVPVEDAVLQALNGTTFGGEAWFVCDDGFVWRRGDNRSVCGADGLWTRPTMVCEEISCGPPVTLPNTNLRWDGSSSPGSAAQYECVDGFYQERGTNISTCSLSGEWGEVSVQCKAECGPFPVLAHSEVLWHNRSVAVHGCVDGYYRWGGSDVSECGSSGVWQEATLTCKAECGPFPVLAHSEVLWHNRSVAVHGCVEGYYRWGGSDVSECLGSGRWREATLTCKAECGPIPILAHSEVLWHNRSVVVHRCVEGYHSWRGSNVSECGSSGQWVEATLKCIETKPPITHLSVFNENCLRWNAEKYEEDTETYKVIYTGSRDYQRSFHDKRKRYVSSRAGQLELCLDLLPVTNYSVSVTAASTGFTASVAASTGLPEPPPPVVHYGEFENPLPTLRLRRSSSTLDPLSVYQVFVIPVEGIVAFDCSSPATSDPSEYVAAQLDLRHVGTEMNFTVGDGRLYGGFHNAPLESGTSYYIILRAVCQWKTEMKSSCVLWAKVRGTSYILRVSSLCGAVFVALATLSVLGGYGFIWCFKKT